MTKTHTDKHIQWSEKCKYFKIDNLLLKEFLENKHDSFMRERGIVTIDGKKKEFMTLTIYFDLEDK